MQFRCPNCKQPIRIEGDVYSETVTINSVECPSCHSRFSLSSNEPSTVVMPIGGKIAHFEIRSLLGQGAFGTVYKAWDTELLREVAVKVPREGRMSSETSKLFLREARAAAGISHPNVVSVFELGQHEESFYIVSEFIEGITLREYLRNNTLSPVSAAQMAIKILRGVQVFHDKGIIHRDLKPGNIILDLRDEPHISDFGLARSDDLNDMSVTRSGHIVGTLLYMPPEQARGEVRGLTNRSDIYAIGVMLYEMLTGVRPFEATSSQTLLHRIQEETPKSIRVLQKNVPRDLEIICLKAMEKDPFRRFESATQMADDLQRFLRREPILSRPVSILEKTWQLIRRHLLTSALAFTLLPLVCLVAYLTLRPEKTRIEPGETRIEEMEETLHQFHVHVGFSLAGYRVPPNALADWTLLPLDSRSREPVLKDAIRISRVAKVSTQLIPGEYLIVVNVDGFGFHEVYRRVPVDPTVVMQGMYPHLRWTLGDDGDITLPDITIRDANDVVADMVSVPGGTFIVGDGAADRPRHERTLSAFFVDPHEVTVDEFTKLLTVGDDYAFPQGNFPVSVHWNKAVAYAELMGKRLLKEDEFEYLARNLGHSKFPHGDTAIEFPDNRWQYSVAGQPEADRLTAVPVYGIHSNVAEWTDSLLNPYPGMPDFGLELELAMNKYGSRVVRGGPVHAGANDRSLNSWNESTSYRSAWDASTIDSEIGFRCARGSSSRFQE